MNPLLKNFLKTAGMYVISEVAREFEITSKVKDKIKNGIIHQVIFDKQYNFYMFKSLNEYLVKYHLDKFTNFTVFSEADELIYNIDAGHILINECGIYISIKKYKTKEDNNSSYEDKYLITVLKKDKEKFQDFIKMLSDNIQYEKVQSDYIYTYVYTEYWETYRKYIPMSLDRVIISQEIIEDLIKDIDKFLAKKDWYLNNNISFKRGYLIHGSPRNGKSSLIAAIARYYKRDIYYLNINSLKDEQQLMYAFKNIEPNSILLIEDIDTVWNERELSNKDSKITFATFINLMSGVLEKEDILIFFTTNYLDRLDKALIGDRRIDKIIEIPTPSKNEIERYLTNLYESEVNLTNYQAGRSMGAIFNLFENYAENKLGLIEYLNNEEPKEFEPEEVKIAPVFNKASGKIEAEICGELDKPLRKAQKIIKSNIGNKKSYNKTIEVPTYKKK